MSALSSAVLGEVLDDRYHLGDCVGEGGMARVYRAEDLVLGRTVAIKVMRPDAEPADSPARVRNEMTMLASLNHQSLVKLLDARIKPSGASYLVMEFVEGETLAQRLDAGEFPASGVAHLATELASALHVVHTAGIVHRDLKPSNVLLTPHPVPGKLPQVKLADFGIAHLVDGTRITAPGTVLGTAAYLSPEQVRGEPAGPPSDIYALGLVLLEALTGERPFAHTSGIGAIMARLLDEPIVPAWVGPAWGHLLTRMTATDPTRRPTALDVFEAARRLPIDLRRRLVPAPSAQPRAVRTPPMPTLPLPIPRSLPRTDSNHLAIARTRRDTRWKRAATAVATTAAASALCVTLGMWTGVGVADSLSAGVEDHPRLVADRVDKSSITQPAVVPAAVTAPVAVETPDDATPHSSSAEADQKAADQASKDAAAAQRETDKATREADRQIAHEQKKQAQAGKSR
jgi:serine/threonine protein kinase